VAQGTLGAQVAQLPLRYLPDSRRIASRQLPNSRQIAPKYVACCNNAFENYSFCYESGPRGSSRHDTVSQRSATSPGSFLSTSRPPETPFLMPKPQTKLKNNKNQNLLFFMDLLFLCLGSYAILVRWVCRFEPNRRRFELSEPIVTTRFDEYS